MAVIYVAGPLRALTTEGVQQNIDNAIEIGYKLIRMGHAPIVPHMNDLLTTYLNDRGLGDLTHEEYMHWDLQLVERCHGLFFVGPSTGANLEYWHAKKSGVLILDKTYLVHTLFCKDCLSPANQPTMDCRGCKFIIKVAAMNATTIYDVVEEVQEDVATRCESQIRLWERENEGAPQGTTRFPTVESG